jgi:type I restriction enzyme S subunit
VEADCTGSTPLTRNRFKEEFFTALEIPLPPLDEQRRIVGRIEQLAAKIQEARRLRHQSTEETDILLAGSSKRFFDPKISDAHAELLESVTLRITKGESPEWQGYTYQDSGPVFIRSENVLWGKLDRSRSVHIPPEFHGKLGRSRLGAGDVLINLVGASIGRACVVPPDIGEANVNQAVAVISPDRGQLDGQYLMHFLISGPTQEVIHGGKVETARPNISLGDLKSLRVPLPLLTEQHRIVAYLDDLQAKVDALKRLQAETAAELDALLPSILDRAFRGGL